MKLLQAGAIIIALVGLFLLVTAPAIVWSQPNERAGTGVLLMVIGGGIVMIMRRSGR